MTTGCLRALGFPQHSDLRRGPCKHLYHEARLYLEDKLERALLRTSGVSSTDVDKGAVSARLSLSEAVSPSIFTSDSNSYTAEKQDEEKVKNEKYMPVIRDLWEKTPQQGSRT